MQDALSCAQPATRFRLPSTAPARCATDRGPRGLPPSSANGRSVATRRHCPGRPSSASPPQIVPSRPKPAPSQVKTSQSSLMAKFPGQGRGMGLVMKNLGDRNPELRGETCRRISGMGIAEDRLGGYAIERLQIGSDPLEQFETATCRHVAEMRRHDSPVPETQRHGILEMAAQGQERSAPVRTATRSRAAHCRARAASAAACWR